MNKNLKALLITLTMTISSTGAYAQDGVIKLPRPDTSRGLPVMEALQHRHSEREFADRMLTEADLSDLLWAANGVNRPDGRRTAATALNKGDVDVYVITAEGAYFYNPSEHQLEQVAKGDHRELIRGGQEDFPLPPVTVVMATTPTRFGVGDNEQARLMGAVDVGIVSQNIALFCAGTGLVTVPRASMNSNAISTLLGLNDETIVLLNNPVGYPVK